MTVRELSKLLSLIPEEYQDLKVVGPDYSIIKGNWKLWEEYPLGDYADPECKYENVIYIEQ